jgi:hypothetical protein
VNEDRYWVDADKARALYAVFELLKTEEGVKRFREDRNAVPGVDDKALEVLRGMDPAELLLLPKINEKLYKAGFGISGAVEMSMV